MIFFFIEIGDDLELVFELLIWAFRIVWGYRLVRARGLNFLQSSKFNLPIHRRDGVFDFMFYDHGVDEFDNGVLVFVVEILDSSEAL
jgi:hypothetical protein